MSEFRQTGLSLSAAGLLYVSFTKRCGGKVLRLGVCLLGFPAVLCAVTPVPTIASLSSRTRCGGKGLCYKETQ